MKWVETGSPAAARKVRHEFLSRAIEPLERRLLLARFAVIADMVDNTALADVADMVTGWNPSHILTAGDNDNLNHTDFESTVGQHFHDWISPYLGDEGPGSTTGNRFWPAMGNHDWESSRGSADYTDYFTLPGKERYYNVRLDDTEFFMVDSDTREPDGTSSTSTQANWLRNAMAASSARWKIVVAHHPPYSSSSSSDATYMRWPLKDWGATAVISGHHHLYERLNVNGLPYFINGPAGGNIGGFGTTDSNSIVRYNGDHGAMQIDTSSSAIVFRFYRRTGALIDSLTVNAPTSPPPPPPPPGSAVTFIASNSSWKYLDNGSNQGTGWRATSFSDSVWASGNAQLGYGDGDEATVVSYGSSSSNKFITTYFRKAFNVNDASAVSALDFRLIRDDGAVVYLNGTEVFRSNMPTGTVSYTTRASSALGGADENAWISGSINPSVLSSGTNVIAVEIHQDGPGSSDISFNFELTGTQSGTTTPQPPAAPGSLAAAAASQTQINLAWADLSSNEDGFKIERSPTGTGSWTQIATLAAGATTYQDTGRTADTSYWYRVRSYNGAGNSSYSNIASATTLPPSPPPPPPPPPGGTVNYIASGGTWKYLDNGSNQGTAWRATSFNDSIWASGASQLGYGDGDEATVVSYGSSSSGKFITTYFRKAFDVADPAAVSELDFRLIRDDGAVVYLNGVEVFRSNMPTGTISYTTRASSALGGTAENAWLSGTLNPALLVAGKNVIAVEIHQDGPTSSDISFNFELTGTASEQAPPASEAPAAPSAASATALSSSEIRVTWIDTADNESGFRVERSTNGTSFTPIATLAAGAQSYSDTTVASGTQYWYRVYAFNAAGDSASSSIATATTPGSSALPSPWQQGDIGTVFAAGSASFADGTFSVTASGTDIWTSADGFRFVYQGLSGDGAIIARVGSVQNTHGWAKAGVMFRETLAANSKQASMHVTPTNGTVMTYRTSTGGSSNGFFDSGSAPEWIRLTRSGSTFTAARSENGSTWTTVGSINISMGSTIYVGLCVSAKNSSTMNTSTFTDVAVSASAALSASQPMRASATVFSSAQVDEEEEALVA